MTVLFSSRLSDGSVFHKQSGSSEPADPRERSAVAAAGFTWGTAAARPPFMATVSLWSSDEAAASYAYGGDPDAGHPGAITKQRQRDFHHESAFIRYVPLAITGSVRGMTATDSSDL